MRKRGEYIVVDGGEGGGKTTHTKLLGEYLDERRVPYLVMREPGGFPVAEQIRMIILDRDFETSEETDFFLFVSIKI